MVFCLDKSEAGLRLHPPTILYPVSCIFVSFIVVSMIAIASLRVPVAHPSRFVSGDTRSGRCSLAPRYRPASAHVICRTALGEAINAASAGDASKVSSLKQRTDRHRGDELANSPTRLRHVTRFCRLGSRLPSATSGGLASGRSLCCRSFLVLFCSSRRGPRLEQPKSLPPMR